MKNVHRMIVTVCSLTVANVFAFLTPLRAQEVTPLEPGKSIEREMTSDQTHTYQVTLSAGQFMRVIVEQKGINVAVALVTPNGKQEVDVNFTGEFGLQESISYEAQVSGNYRLALRVVQPTLPEGKYQIRLEVKSAATAQDKQRIIAERQLMEVINQREQGTAPEQAIEKGQQVLTLWRALGDRYWEARILRVLSDVYVLVGKTDQAIEYLDKGLAIRREIKDRDSEAYSLLALGNIARRQGQSEKAIAYLEQAQTIFRDIKNPFGEFATLDLFAVMYFSQNQFEKAIRYFEQVLSHQRERKEPVFEVAALVGLGESHFSLKRPEQAEGYIKQAVVRLSEVKNRTFAGRTLSIIGHAYLNQKDYEQAMTYFAQALAIQREAKDRLNEGRALLDLGTVNRSLRRYEKALEYTNQALSITREVKNRPMEIAVLNNLAVTYGAMGRNEKAIEFYEQALAIVRERGDRFGERTIVQALGYRYSHIGRFDKAVGYKQQAIAIAREIKDRNGEGSGFHHLGIIYYNLGQYEKAIEYLEQGAAIYREVKARRSEGYAIVHIGTAHRLLNQFEKATAHYEQALIILREVNAPAVEGETLSGLGIINLKQNRPEKALEYHEKALALVRAAKDRGREGDVLDNLGEALRAMKRFDQAIDYHEMALRIARESQRKSLEASALNNLMRGWDARQQPRHAVFFGKQAVNVYQEIRSNLIALDQDTQQSFIKSKEQSYRHLADLLIAQGRLPEAEQVINLLKEEEYFDFIRRDQANTSQAKKAELTPEEAALEKRYREISNQLATLGTERSALLEKPSRTPEEEQRLTKLDADMMVAGQMFQKFLDGLANELGKGADDGARVFQLRESQGMMEALRDLGKGVVALYTLVGEEQYRVILTTADVQKGFAYPIKAADLNRKILAFRDVLQNPKLDPLPLAQELYKILVAPLAKDLKAAKAETLMWSLDGVLRYVPIAALHDGKQYLVESWRNVVFTPASQTRLKDDVSRNWKALGLGVTKAHGLTIPALPGVLEEMRGIIKADGATSGVLPGTIKLDEQFTQEAMLTGLRQRPPVVNVASHFQFKPGNETDSALLLGDGQFLSLAQIKSLPNVFSGVELLTLSACNTATGGSGATGKEVEGFGVLAQRQGAKAVIASLWPVADRSTKNLMQEFYKLREAKANTTKAEAMRQAQIKLLRGELQVTGEALAARSIVHEEDKTANKPKFKVDPKAPYAHPYYWAPFILIGNWK